MDQIKEGKLLSAYIIYRELYGEAKRDVYDVVSEFVKYVILKNGKNHYNQMELSKLLKDEFGFSIPDLVLKPSAKRLDGVEFKDKIYVDYSKLGENTEFSFIQKESVQKSNDILTKLFEYVENKRKTADIEVSKQKIYKSFRRYLLDKSIDDEYSDLISAFIIENSNDEKFVNELNKIRAGHILYMGLSYNDNINISGRWTDKLVIFLDMEILFHLVGYNGEVFQKLSLDLIELIKKANKGKRLIHLRYFSETKRDIEKFFDKAEKMVETKSALIPGLTAMEIITDHCKEVSDVVDKKSDFYTQLRYMGISECENTNFYSQNLKKYNLESKELIDEFTKEEDDKEANYTRLALVSHINKMRRGRISTDYSKCEYILLTETGKTLEMNAKLIKKLEEEMDQQYIVPYAVNLYTLTNTLWYRLNRDFGIEGFPETMDVVMKAQIALSSLINETIVKQYNYTREQFENGRIDKETLAARILGLRKHSRKPENVVKEGVDEAIKFICENDINAYEEEFELIKDERDKAKVKVSVLKDEKRQVLEENEKISHENEIMKLKLERERHEKNILLLKEQIKQYEDTVTCNRSIKVDYNAKRKLTKIIISILFLAFPIIMASLIMIFSWDVMEYVTYLLGVMYTVFLIVLKIWRTDVGSSMLVEKLVNIFFKVKFTKDDEKEMEQAEEILNEKKNEIKKVEQEINHVNNLLLEKEER